jgi:putative folate metabolism gamma-glutamate ligase
MVITPLKTHKITSNDTNLLTILDTYITDIPERSVLAVTSKIVAICEGRVAPAGADKDELIIQEAQYYLPRELNRYHIMVTINDHIVAAAAGIDESNIQEGYVLWPKDVQASANIIREYLISRFGLKEVGVVITDSKTTPLRWGVTGIGLAHSGFLALNNYIGTEDLFGREMHVTKVNVMDGLASSAVYVMGEGKEQTPLALITDIPHIQFQDHNPTEKELKAVYLNLDEDLYGQMLQSAPWKKGKKSSK